MCVVNSNKKNLNHQNSQQNHRRVFQKTIENSRKLRSVESLRSAQRIDAQRRVVKKIQNLRCCHNDNILLHFCRILISLHCHSESAKGSDHTWNKSMPRCKTQHLFKFQNMSEAFFVSVLAYKMIIKIYYFLHQQKEFRQLVHDFRHSTDLQPRNEDECK